MAWPYTQGEVADALTGKLGFEQDDCDHTFYVLELDGRAAAYTYMSRGRRDRIAPRIAKDMAKQMRLRTLAEFRNAIDCPMTVEEYHRLIRAQRRGHPG